MSNSCWDQQKQNQLLCDRFPAELSPVLHFWQPNLQGRLGGGRLRISKLPAASPPPTLSGLFLYFAGFFTSLFLSCRFHQVRFPGNQRLLNIPLSMILLSCLSVLTLSCGNLLNSALTYGDFLKITNLLIIIIKKHLTGGNSTSKLYGVPQREEGRSATLSNT